MFEKLFGKKEINRFTDKTYITKHAKYAAIIYDATNNKDAIIICWFQQTFDELRNEFSLNNLEDSKVQFYRNYHHKENNVIFFAEHYPLHQKEIDFVQHWNQKFFIVFNALDEPLFKTFGSDKIVELLNKLGMKDNDCIEHSLVTKAITNAQNKIADLNIIEQYAYSQEEWMSINFKKLI